MGIRKEIEKLLGLPQRTTTYPSECFYPTEWVCRVDIHSILDEHLGECVTEGIVDFGLTAAGYRCVLDKRGLFDILSKEKGVRPGDHISIYVRRKNESGS